MLPESLVGPGQTINFHNPESFLEKNQHLYPNLDRDFILQICFEHPARFDGLFPYFDPRIHSAVRRKRTVNWVSKNVRYDRGMVLDFWFKQFDYYLEVNDQNYSIFRYMIDEKKWPFPPVVIEVEFAKELGFVDDIGTGFYLIEGTHRISYLLRMQQLGYFSGGEMVELIELEPIGLRRPDSEGG